MSINLTALDAISISSTVNNSLMALYFSFVLVFPRNMFHDTMRLLFSLFSFSREQLRIQLKDLLFLATDFL